MIIFLDATEYDTLFFATIQKPKVEVCTMYIVVKNVTIYANEGRNKGRKLDGTTSQ